MDEGEANLKKEEDQLMMTKGSYYYHRYRVYRYYNRLYHQHLLHIMRIAVYGSLEGCAHPEDNARDGEPKLDEGVGDTSACRSHYCHRYEYFSSSASRTDQDTVNHNELSFFGHCLWPLYLKHKKQQRWQRCL